MNGMRPNELMVKKLGMFGCAPPRQGITETPRSALGLTPLPPPLRRCVFLVLVGAIKDEHKSSVAGMLLEAEQKARPAPRVPHASHRWLLSCQSCSFTPLLSFVTSSDGEQAQERRASRGEAADGGSFYLRGVGAGAGERLSHRQIRSAERLQAASDRSASPPADD